MCLNVLNLFFKRVLDSCCRINLTGDSFQRSAGACLDTLSLLQGCFKQESLVKHYFRSLGLGEETKDTPKLSPEFLALQRGQVAKRQSEIHNLRREASLKFTGSSKFKCF